MLSYLLLVCAILFQSQAEAEQEVKLNACIHGHDVYLITDVHTNDTDEIQQVESFLEELSALIDTHNTWFSILGFPRANSGGMRWTKENQIQGAKNHVVRNMKDPSKHPDTTIALQQVSDTIYGYRTMRSNAPDSLIILTNNRLKTHAVPEEEEEEEDKGLDSPSEDGKVQIAEIAEKIQAVAMIYVIAIGTFKEYELSDVASCKSHKCLTRLDSFDKLQGLAGDFLTPDC